MDRKTIFRQLRSEGYTLDEIGKMYSLSHQMVSYICRDKVKKPNKYKKLKIEHKGKSYLDYLRQSDYSDRVKSYYIKNYGNIEAEKSL